MSGNAEKIFKLIQTCKESLAKLVEYKVTAELDGTLQERWAEFMSDITVFRDDFILFSRSLTSRKPVDELVKRLEVIQEKFSETFGGVFDDAKLFVAESRRCLESLKFLYYQLPTETVTVTEQYKLLRDINWEEEKNEKEKKERRQEALTNKIEKIIAKFPSDPLERRLYQLNGDIITEIERIYNLSRMKTETHFMKEESLAVTIETLNLEISRLKSKLTEKKGHSWNPFARPPPKKHDPMEVDALLTTLKTYV